MTIEDYEKFTGVKVPANKVDFIKAQIERAKAKLETLLGYTLEPSHIYNELGKSQVDCSCPDIPHTGKLLPPDEVQGIVKIFPYNSKDKFFMVDPFINVYSVKLVTVMEDYNYVTQKTFEYVTTKYGRDGIGKYIEKCKTCICECICQDCVQLAVDADWITELPMDLMYLWCDMVDYYADCGRNIKSESVDGHSWTKDNTIAPEETKESMILLLRYAGPYGSVARMPVI